MLQGEMKIFLIEGPYSDSGFCIVAARNFADALTVAEKVVDDPLEWKELPLLLDPARFPNWLNLKAPFVISS